MPGWKRLSALLAVAAVATAATGCGSNGIKGTIPTDQAAALVSDLDAVQSAAEAGDCEAAAAGADRFVATVNELPEPSGAELKAALRDAGTKLKTLPPCEPAGTTGAQGDTHSTTADTTPSTATPSTTTPTTTTPSVSTSPETSPSGDNHGGGSQQPPSSNPGGNGQGGDETGQGGGNPGGGSTGGTGGTGGTGVGSG